MTWKHDPQRPSPPRVGPRCRRCTRSSRPRSPPRAAADPVAAVKQSLQQGLAKARGYEWVETTIISLKGEEKARKQNRCYYGADGKVQKIPIDQPAAQEKEQAAAGGRRGGGKLKEKVVENKKDEIQEYMKKAAALIHSYVPPDGDKIQAAKAAGRVKPRAAGRREDAHRDRGLPAARRLAHDRPRHRGQPADRPGRQFVPREEGRRGDAGGADEHAGRRRALRRPDDARRRRRRTSPS